MVIKLYLENMLKFVIDSCHAGSASVVIVSEKLIKQKFTFPEGNEPYREQFLISKMLKKNTGIGPMQVFRTETDTFFGVKTSVQSGVFLIIRNKLLDDVQSERMLGILNSMIEQIKISENYGNLLFVEPSRELKIRLLGVLSFSTISLLIGSILAILYTSQQYKNKIENLNTLRQVHLNNLETFNRIISLESSQRGFLLTHDRSFDSEIKIEKFAENPSKFLNYNLFSELDAIVHMLNLNLDQKIKSLKSEEMALTEMKKQMKNSNFFKVSSDLLSSGRTTMSELHLDFDFLNWSYSNRLNELIESAQDLRNRSTFIHTMVLSLALISSMLSIVMIRRFHRKNRQILDRLKSEKMQSNSILHSLPDMLFVIAPDHSVIRSHLPASLRSNNRIEKYEDLRIFEKLDTKVFSAIKESVELAKSKKEVSSFEFEYPSQMGAKVLSARVVPAFENHVIFTARDVTNEAQSRSIIERQSTQLQENTKMATIGMMAGGVAHEINNPLGVITMIADSLKHSITEGDTDPVDAIEKLEKIHATVDRISRITRSLTMLTRSGQEFDIKEWDIKEIFVTVKELCANKLKEARVEMLSLVHNPSAEKVKIAETQIVQVLVNLISNSCDVLQEIGGGWVKVSVDVGKNELHIDISDSGPRIPNSIKSQFFQPFFTTKMPGKGTGLGLPICKKIIEAHGGKIEFNDKVENTFQITLPIAKLECLHQRNKQIA